MYQSGATAKHILTSKSSHGAIYDEQNVAIDTICYGRLMPGDHIISVFEQRYGMEV